MASEKEEPPCGLCKYDADFLKSFHCYIKDLRNLTISNIEFYQRGSSSLHARYYATSCILLERIQLTEPIVIEIVPRLQEFDFSNEIHANGYRSFISITNSCCVYLLQLCRHININKNGLLFRSSHYLKELEAYVETLGQLVACLGYLKQLISFSKDGDLFVEENRSAADDLLLEVEMLNTDCFYGRCLGFQFSESIQKVLHGVLVVMATFSECYEESSQVMQLATSLFNSGKYVVDQDLRAKQVVNITRTADIKFCKAFWSIPESPLFCKLRAFTFPHVEVSEVMSLETVNFELPDEVATGTTVTITPPCAHTGPAPVKVRLISHAVREGMQHVTRSRFKPNTGSSKPSVLPMSRGLLFHCHGGGFVAQSSQSHENYLRVWARILQMPILSVDYSLAPDLPFPRALEECFYAYAWALKHPDQLGWTGERVCFAGDSAGGNLVISTALRAVAYQIRVPDGIMAAYTPFLVQYTPSPARLMSMIDPLLPVGILTRCLAAYAGIADEFSSALAKPIFCNPGNVETYEIVDPQEVTEDSIGAQLTNANACTSSVGQVAIERNNICHLCSIKGGATKCNCSSSEPDGQVDNLPPNSKLCDNNHMASKSDCDILEDLDENQFVICDMDEFESDSSYKGTVTVIDETDIEERSCNAGAISIADNDVDMHVDALDKDNTWADNDVSHLVPKSTDDTNIGDRVLSSFCMPYTESMEEAISQIDANVTIHIEDMCTSEDVLSSNAVSEQTDDPTQEYAMCQELVELTAHGGSSLGAQCRSLSEMSDMSRISCHSIDELNDSDWIMGEQGNSTNKICDTVSSLNYMEIIETDQNSLSSKDVCRLKDSSYIKQLSMSDTSDSGVHCDTDVDICHDNPIMNTVPSDPQQSLESDLSKVIQTPFKHEKDQTQTEVSDGNLEHFRHDPNHSPSRVNFNRRVMSLDLQFPMHPSQVYAKTTSPLSGSPISPKLPPGSRSFEPKRYSVQRKIAQSPIQLFKQLPIVKNMYMSPILAPDDMLLGLPDVYLVACHFDPLLDDSITFAKKLSGLGKMVDLHVFDGLPHGFLSFSDASPEAKNASKFCLEKIKKVLQVD